MSKISVFDYEKENGDKSKRMLLVLHDGSPNLKGIDITNLDEDEFARFVVEYNEYNEKQKEALSALLKRHDLKHNFRAFKPSGITNIEHMDI